MQQFERDEGSLGTRAYEAVAEYVLNMFATSPVPGAPAIKLPPAVEVAEKVVSTLEFVGKLFSLSNELETAEERTRLFRRELEEQQRHTDDLCNQLGDTAPPQCNRRCPEFALDNVSAYYTTTAPDSGLPRQVNELDQLNHCMCKHVGERLVGGGCESEEDRERQECLRNPDGPDGAPKPECQRHLMPMDLDMTVLRGKMCERMLPNCDGVYLTEQRACGCADVTINPGDATDLCRNADAINCGPEGTLDLKTCACVYSGTSAPGYGTQGPGCLLDPVNFGANVRPMLTTQPEVLTSALLYTDTGPLPVIRTNPGFEPFATAPLRIADFPSQLDSTLKLDIDFPAELETRRAGSTSLNVSVFSRSGSLQLINEPIGTIPHSNLQAGAINTVAFDLPSHIQDRLAQAELADDDVHFIFTNDTPLDIAVTPGIGRLDLGGAPRPVAERSPLCDRGPSVRPSIINPGPSLTPSLQLDVPVDDIALPWPFEGL